MVACPAAKEALPLYAHRFSPKKFTQPQLFACLVLKAMYRLDYRGVVEMLRDSSDLCVAIELTKIPHFTTLCPCVIRAHPRDESRPLTAGYPKGVGTIF